MNTIKKPALSAGFFIVDFFSLLMKLPAASSGVSVYRRIQQAFTASGGEIQP
jgi:hypothetical protein